ncbi:acyl-CoA synthetase [Cumulibacter soli]|uniref:acyl-CoA synthetase n=1 Tax=Cumulibacter soli TaxID=2546344 RepID=UPI00141A1FD0|nr:AMP-binding protein [Cumulibacter soli]
MPPFTHVRDQVVTDASSWQDAVSRHAWKVPEHYNITADIVDSWALSEEHSDRAALAVLDENDHLDEVSFGRLRELTARLGTALGELGVRRADVVSIVLTQSIEAAVSQLAAYRIGAIACPISHLYAGDALIWRLQHSQTRVVIANNEAAAAIAARRQELPDLRHIVRVDELWSLIDRADADCSPANTRAEDPALLIYTSGTTGNPKGALHAHRVALGHANVSYLLEGINETDRYYSPNDWSWIAGVGNGLLAPLGFGATVLSMGSRPFDPHATADFIDTYRPSVGYLPVSGMRQMRHVGTRLTHRYRAILTGGETLSDDLRDWCLANVTDTINNGFGQTEGNDTLGVVSGWENPPPETVGRVLPGHEAIVSDAEDAELPDGTEGQLLLREHGRPVFLLEYFKNPEATAELKKAGWIHTGDTVSRDERGYFHFAGRGDDVIKSSGYRIGPSEIETVVDAHPDVLECVVIGLPDPDRGQVVTAVVRLAPGADEALVREQLIASTRAKIGKHAYVRRVEVIDEFPKTVTGKPQRAVVRQHFS